MAMNVCEGPSNLIKINSDGRSATLAGAPKEGQGNSVFVSGDEAAKLASDEGRVVLRIPPHDKPIKLRVVIADGTALDQSAQLNGELVDLEPLTQENKARWGDAITTDIHLGDDQAFRKERAEIAIGSAQKSVNAAQNKVTKAKSDNDRQRARETLREAKSELERQKKLADEEQTVGLRYVVDTVEVPFENRFNSWMRTGALDFFSDGRCAISTWSGDVWIVSFDDDFKHAHWKRFATGLFQPLGLKILNDTVYVQGRDQITILHDTTNSGEANYYENLNNDVQVTSSFHEFSFDLQVDNEGNFYFAKAGPVRPGGRGWQQISRDNGTVIKVSKDGKTLTTYAVGVRAPNGMGFGGPDNIVSVADNEGTWTPTDRLDFVKPGSFLGVVDLCHSENKPTKPGDLVCWLPHNGNPDYGVIENSNGSQEWVKDDRFGPFKDTMLYLSYGTCSLFHISYEKVGDQYQGGAVKFPLGFDSGSMRIRMNPKDGMPWVTGLRGCGKPPLFSMACCSVSATPANRSICPLIGTSIQTACRSLSLIPSINPPRSIYKTGSLSSGIITRTGNYGSEEWSVKEPEKKGHDPVDIKSIKLSDDGKTVTLNLAQVVPVMQMRIKMNVKAADGQTVNTNIFTTINVVLPGRGGEPAIDEP